MNELFETQQLKISELIPSTKNPRKIKQVEKHKLWLRIQKYGMIGIPVMDADGTLLSGHQRCQVLRDYGFDDMVIDVRVAKRKLTEPELKEVMIIENSHAGEFDLNMLHQEFQDFVNLEEYHIDIDELNKDLVEMADAIEESEPEMPIVQKFSEKYTSFVIVCTDEIDENHIAEKLGIEQGKCYKSSKVGMMHVLNAKQVIERWK